MKVAKNAFFITLTYNERNIPRTKDGYTYVSKQDAQKFVKRLRHRMGMPKDFKYYLASEYGPTTMRPHYHAILFNLTTDDEMKARKLIARSWSITDKSKNINSLGFIQVEKVNENRIAYVTGYCMDKDKNVHSNKKVFSIMSKGLGKAYLDSAERVSWHKDKPLENMYYPIENGKKLALPRYYKEKINDSKITREIIRGINEKEHLTTNPNGAKARLEHLKLSHKIKMAEIRHNKKQKLRKL